MYLHCILFETNQLQKICWYITTRSMWVGLVNILWESHLLNINDIIKCKISYYWENNTIKSVKAISN